MDKKRALVVASLVAGLLNADPSIEVKMGDCPTVGKIVEDKCEYRDTPREGERYATFVESNMPLIKAMYDFDEKYQSCSGMASSVASACQTKCTDKDCLWILSERGVKSDQGTPENDLIPATLAGFYDRLVFENPPIRKLASITIITPRRTPPDEARNAEPAKSREAPAPATPNYLPGNYLLGVPSRNLRQ